MIYTDLAQKYPLKSIRHEKGPLGYGKTIITLFKEAKKDYDVLITFDADLQHAPFTIKEIIDTMVKNPDLDVVSTSRYLTYRFQDNNTEVPIDRYVTNMFITRTINEVLDIGITDSFCGLKGYRTSILPTKIDDAGYSFPLVFWSFCYHNKLVIEEIETPIIYRLDRRPRGEWKTRTREYFQILESLMTNEKDRLIIERNRENDMKQITEIIDQYSDLPIYTYNDFFKVKWIDTKLSKE